MYVCVCVCVSVHVHTHTHVIVSYLGRPLVTIACTRTQLHIISKHYAHNSKHTQRSKQYFSSSTHYAYLLPIQDIPAHLTTPLRPYTPIKPLSTSAPSCYDKEATPMRGLMDTPVEMILSTRKPKATGTLPPSLVRIPEMWSPPVFLESGFVVRVHSPYLEMSRLELVSHPPSLVLKSRPCK